MLQLRDTLGMCFHTILISNFDDCILGHVFFSKNYYKQARLDVTIVNNYITHWTYSWARRYVENKTGRHRERLKGVLCNIICNTTFFWIKLDKTRVLKENQNWLSLKIVLFSILRILFSRQFMRICQLLKFLEENFKSYLNRSLKSLSLDHAVNYRKPKPQAFNIVLCSCTRRNCLQVFFNNLQTKKQRQNV